MSTNLQSKRAMIPEPEMLEGKLSKAVSEVEVVQQEPSFDTDVQSEPVPAKENVVAPTDVVPEVIAQEPEAESSSPAKKRSIEEISNEVVENPQEKKDEIQDKRLKEETAVVEESVQIAEAEQAQVSTDPVVNQAAEEPKPEVFVAEPVADVPAEVIQDQQEAFPTHCEEAQEVPAETVVPELVPQEAVVPVEDKHEFEPATSTVTEMAKESSNDVEKMYLNEHGEGELP